MFNILKKIRRNKLDNKGQSIVEFAIVAPIFIMLLVVVILAGQVIVAKMAANSAAQAGCREAILYEDKDNALEHADKKAKVEMDNGISLSYVSSDLSSSTEDGDEYYTYTITFESEGLISFEELLGDGKFTATVTMMAEY